MEWEVTGNSPSKDVDLYYGGIRIWTCVWSIASMPHESLFSFTTEVHLGKWYWNNWISDATEAKYMGEVDPDGETRRAEDARQQEFIGGIMVELWASMMNKSWTCGG